MCYPLTHFLLEDAPENVPYPTDALFIEDGNALFHAMTNLPSTFGGCHLSPRARPDDKKLHLLH